MVDVSLTRKELSAFLPTQRAIRAFEEILKTTTETTPSNVVSTQGAQITADQAVSLATAALKISQSIMSDIAVLYGAAFADDNDDFVHMSGLVHIPDNIAAPAHIPLSGHTGNVVISGTTLHLLNGIVRNVT